MGGQYRWRIGAQHQQAQGTGADRPERQPARHRHAGRRQLVQRQAQQQDHQQTQGDGHRVGPQHIAGDEHRELLASRQVRDQQPATGGGDFRSHHGQQPDGGHLVDAVLLASEHQIGNQHPAGQRHGRIQPPEAEGHRHHGFTPARQAEQQQPIDQRRQAHGNGAEEHGHRGVGEHLPGLVEEQ
ncbi:hypothetical protein Q3H58_002522 [Pseudomonas psychrotolerans]|nr:hypothetical protein [Pseudomonas psychrotolerans]